MKKMRAGWKIVGWCSLVTVAQILVASCGGSPAARSVSPELDGAWSKIHSETIAPDGTRYPGSNHESFLLIADGFYSMNWAFGAQPSPYYAERFHPTDAEMIARYGALLVNAGRFELAGNVLTIHPLFALVPEFIGGLGEFEYSLDGDSLQLVWRRIVSADGVQDPNTAAGVRYVSRWKRISRQADAG